MFNFGVQGPKGRQTYTPTPAEPPFASFRDGKRQE